jgi:hypothetical protein
MSCNFATHAICPLAFTAYKYSELQMFFATQKLSCKANCKTPFFLIMLIEELKYFKELHIDDEV